MKLIIFIVLTISISTFGQTSPNNSKVLSLMCVGTTDEPGVPRDMFVLEQTAGATFKAKYAKAATANISLVQYTDLEFPLKCEFAAIDPRMFICNSTAGVIRLSKTTEEKIPVSGFAPRQSTSAQILITGDDFATTTGELALKLNFLFINDCQVTPAP